MSLDHLHNLLRRQLLRHIEQHDALPDAWRELLAEVDRSYRQFDDDRTMLERSLDLSSQELLQANAEMRAICRLLPDVFFRLDADGVIRDCNSAQAASLRFNPRAYIGRRLPEIPVPEVGAQFEKAIAEVRARQGTVVLDYTDRQDGAERFYEASLLPLVEDQIVVFVRDVTERRLGQAQQMRLATIVEQTDETVTITDLEGRIVYVNPAFERLTGHAAADVMGRNPRLLKSGRQDEAYYRSMWAHLTAGQTWRGRFTNRRKDGSLYQVDSIISPIRDPQGKVVNYAAISHDISRELQLEEQLHQAQKMEAIGQLAGGVAHDFNNLLTAIMGNCELAEDRLEPRHAVRREVEEIRKAAARAATLTTQLLAFGRRQVMHPKLISLNAVVLQMSSMLQRIIGENIELKTKLAPHLGAIHGDPVQLEQVIMNLVINARDAMPRGGRLVVESDNLEADVELMSRIPELRAGHHIVLRVRDSGTGMSEEVRSHLFEPFFTTKEVGKGSGLGLATVYGIVKQSGGHIAVQTVPGIGTTFQIYFPRAGDEVTLAVPEVRPALEESRGQETVLLVEDEAPIRRLACTLLRRYGYRVLEAAHGEEALAVLDAHPERIDLMLTDVMMPGISGGELAQRLAQVRPDIKVLYMSGHPDHIVMEMGVLTSGDRFIKKPFTGHDLAVKLRHVLDGAPA